jgi:mevalonate kinase
VRARIGELRSVIDEIGAVSEAVIARLSAGGTLFDARPSSERTSACSSALGVSTERIDALVAWALERGATAAKLSGAGGGGIVIAVHEDPDALVADATLAGHSPSSPRGRMSRRRRDRASEHRAREVLGETRSDPEPARDARRCR